MKPKHRQVRYDGPVRLYYRFCRLCCRWFYILFARGRAYGVDRVPRDGGVLLVANHQSFLDPVVATLALPREGHYMARDSLFRFWVFRRLIESLNAFPIRRTEADLRAIKESLRRLKRGAALLTFPEGTRTRDGRIGPLMPGIAAVARKARVPIVPVVIEGAFEAWPRHALLPRPGRIAVEYGRPITPEQYAAWSAPELVAVLQRRLYDLQRRVRTRRGQPVLQ